MELNTIFLSFVLFTIFQRLAELVLAKRNTNYLVSQGGKIIPEKNYIAMVLLHTTWLTTLLYSVLNYQVNFNSISFYLGLFFFLLGQSLRLTAILTLGKRWTTRVVVINQAAIKKGIFNYIRHPNYFGVALEIFGLPLLLGRLDLAIIFSFINGLILFYRIGMEEEMLSKYSGYKRVFNLKDSQGSVCESK